MVHWPIKAHGRNQAMGAKMRMVCRRGMGGLEEVVQLSKVRIQHYPRRGRGSWRSQPRRVAFQTGLVMLEKGRWVGGQAAKERPLVWEGGAVKLKAAKKRLPAGKGGAAIAKAAKRGPRVTVLKGVARGGTLADRAKRVALLERRHLAFRRRILAGGGAALCQDLALGKSLDSALD